MKIHVIILGIVLSSLYALAGNPGVSYQGRIIKPDGNPLEGLNVQFRMQIRSPGSENCLLYEETQTINMSGTSGVFSVTLNDGTGIRLDTPTYQIDRIFANRDTMTLDSARCAVGTTYVPNSGDGRKFVVYFKDETMAAFEPLPILSLNYAPQSMYALESQKIDKFSASQLVRAVDGSGNPTTAPALDPTQLTEFVKIINGTSTNYVSRTTTSGMSIPSYSTATPPASPSEGSFWYDSTDKQIKYYNGSATVPLASSGSIAASSITTGVLNTARLGTGTANSTTYLRGDGTWSTVSSSSQWTTSGSNIYFNTGNTGIGTPTPGHTLHVMRAAGSTYGAMVDSSSSSTYSNLVVAKAGVPFGVIGVNGSGDIDFSVTSANSASSKLRLAGCTGVATHMTIDGNGNVGIGITSPQTTFQVAGIISPSANNTYSLGNATYGFTEVYATNGTINTSDRREKKDIYNSNLGLEFINKLRPVSYRWNTGVDNDIHYGLIAQEAEAAVRDARNDDQGTSIVTHDKITDKYGVRYSELISPIIKAIQEIYFRVTSAERELASLKEETAASLKIKDQEIELLKKENLEIKARLEKLEMTK